MGDNTFCGAYKIPTYRIVNKLDLVPEVPLTGVAVHLPANLPSFLKNWTERLDRAVADVPISVMSQRSCTSARTGPSRQTPALSHGARPPSLKRWPRVGGRIGKALMITRFSTTSRRCIEMAHLV